MNLSDRWNRLRNRWLLMALAVPVVVFPWSFDATELPKLTFLRLIALGLIVTGLFTVSRSAWASSDEKQVSEIHPLRLPILLFLILMGFSALQSTDRWSSLAALMDLALLAFYTFTVTGASKGSDFQRNAWRALVAVGGIGAGWALLQLSGFDPLNAGALHRSVGLPVGPTSDPATLAGLLAAVFPLAVGISIRVKKLSWETACLFLIALALGLTRQPLYILGGVVGAGLTLGLTGKVEGFGPRSRWVLPLAAVLLLFMGFGIGRTPRSENANLDQLRATAVTMVRAQPLYGWGPGAFGLIAPHYSTSEASLQREPNTPPAANPRNLPLWILTSGGVLSLLAFLWVLAGTGFQLAKRMAMSGDGAEEDGADASEHVTASDRSTASRISDAGLAAAWAGFLAAWLIQSWSSTPSVALMLPFWCVLGLASTSIRPAKKSAPYRRWPVPLRVAGVAAAAFLLVPLPTPEYVMHRGKTSFSLGSELLPGPGAAIRWLIGDVYYRSAIRARDEKQWDRALVAHLNALMWAPSRMENWVGHGDTAYHAMRIMSGKPVFWLQYGTLAYYRAQQMQPRNGYLYYGEGRLLAEAVRKGGRRFYPDAKSNFEKAIQLYPNVARFHAEYGNLLDSMGERESARRQKDLAFRLDSSRAGVDRRERNLVGSLNPSDGTERIPSGTSNSTPAQRGTDRNLNFVANNTLRGDRGVH